MYKNMLRQLKDKCGISYAKMAELIHMNYNTFRVVMNTDGKDFTAVEKANINTMVQEL